MECRKRLHQELTRHSRKAFTDTIAKPLRKHEFLIRALPSSEKKLNESSPDSSIQGNACSDGVVQKRAVWSRFLIYEEHEELLDPEFEAVIG